MDPNSALLLNKSIDTHVLSLIEKLDALRGSVPGGVINASNANSRNKSLAKRRLARQEIRTLELWRSIMCECLSTLFFVFLVCGSYVPWQGWSPTYVGVSLVTGFAAMTMTLCFGQGTGMHMNPAITLAMFAADQITALRAILYAIAQSGGAIAGAALIYGMTPGRSHLGVTVLSDGLSTWAGFGLELVLSFILASSVLTAFHHLKVSSASNSGLQSANAGFMMCAAYVTCSLVAVPATRGGLNPARSLGPAFVMNRWEDHWIYWLGPMAGGGLAGLLRKYVFDPERRNTKGSEGSSGSLPNDGSSVNSGEEADCCDDDDDIESKTTAGHPSGGHGDVTITSSFSPLDELVNRQQPAQRRSVRGAQSVYSAPAYDRHQHRRRSQHQVSRPAPVEVEEIYNGSKSLYGVRVAGAPQVTSGPSRSTCVNTSMATAMASNISRAESVWCRLPEAIDLASDFSGHNKKPHHINRSRSIYVPRSPENQNGQGGKPIMMSQLSKSQILLSPLGGDTGNLMREFKPAYRQGPLPPPPPPPPVSMHQQQQQQHQQQMVQHAGSDASVQNRANESFASKPGTYDDDEDEIYQAKREAQARAAASAAGNDIYQKREDIYVARSESGYGTLGSNRAQPAHQQQQQPPQHHHHMPPQSQAQEIVPPPAFFSGGPPAMREPPLGGERFALYSSPQRQQPPPQHHQQPYPPPLRNGCGHFGSTPPSGFSTPRSMFSPVSHCSGISEL